MALTKNQLNEWLDLLRSGEVKQGYSMLKGGDSYCCLGVLTEKVLGFDLEALTEGEVGTRAGAGQTYAQTGGVNYDVPTPLREALPVDVRAVLGSRNDGGATFPMVADYIEELVSAGSIKVVE